MASVRNLARNVGSTTLNMGRMGASALGSRAMGAASGLAQGAKAAAMSEMPGLLATYGFAKSIGGGSTTFKDKKEEKAMQTAQVISLEQVRQLKTLNDTARSQLGVQKKSLDQDTKRNKDEKKRHKELLEALEDFDGGDGGGIVSDTVDAVVDFAKFLGKAAAGVIGGVVGGAALTRFGPFRGQGARRPRGRGYSGGPPLLPTFETTQNMAPFETGASTGGTAVQVKQKIIPTKDETAAKLLKEANAISKSNLEISKRSDKWVGTQSRDYKFRKTKPVDTRTEEEKILDKANADFLKGFQKTTTSIFKESLLEVFPDPKGVSARTASGQLYRGVVLGDILQIDEATTRIFGKKFGPLFSKLADSYLEVGARKVGESLFSNMLTGFGAKEAQALTGQILGNYKAGKKTLAAEQLIYGLTGIPLGTETLANKFGYANTTQGIEGVANALGAATQSMLFGGETSYIDPRTGKTVQYTGFGDALGQLMGDTGGGWAGMLMGKKAVGPQVVNMPAKVVSTSSGAAQLVYIAGSYNDQQGVGATGATGTILDDFASVVTGNKPKAVADATVNTSETLDDMYAVTVDAYGQEVERDHSIAQDDIKTQVGVGQGIMGTFQSVGQFLMGGLNNIVSAIASMGGRGGGGTIIGGGGDFMSMMGNVLGSVAIATVADKLTKGIKNPTARMVANIGLNYAGQKYLMGNFGGVAGTGRSIFSGANPLQTGGIIPFDPLSYLGTLSANMGFASGANFFAGMSSVGQGAAFPSAATYGTAGQLGYMAGQVAPYADAIIRGFKGDLGGAAASALGTYGVAQLGIAATGSSLGASAFLMANPLWAAGALILGSFLGDMFGSKPKKPVLERVIAIRGNNDPKNIITTQERHKNMSDLYPGVDSLLMVAFNTLKLIEQKTGKTPFTHVGLFIRLGGNTVVSLYRESEKSILASPRGDKFNSLKYVRDYGNPQNAFKNPGELASKIVDFIRDSIKTETHDLDSVDADHKAIVEATDVIQSKAFGEIANEVIRELDNLNPEVKDFYATSDTAKTKFNELMQKHQQLLDEGKIQNMRVSDSIWGPKRDVSAFESAEKTQYVAQVDSGGEQGYTTETRSGSVGIYDIGTGQVVPYGSKITYTENGVDKTITLDRDATGVNKVVGIVNGVPIFETGTEKGLDIQDYVDFARRTGIDLTPTENAPLTFLPKDTRTDVDIAKESYTEAKGRTYQTNVVAPTNNSQQNYTYSTNDPFGSVDPLRAAGAN